MTPQSTLQAKPVAYIKITLTKGKTLSGTMKYIVNTDKFKQVVSTHTCHHFIDKWATKSCKYGGLEGKDTKKRSGVVGIRIHKYHNGVRVFGNHFFYYDV